VNHGRAPFEAFRLNIKAPDSGLLNDATQAHPSETRTPGSALSGRASQKPALVLGAQVQLAAASGRVEKSPEGDLISPAGNNGLSHSPFGREATSNLGDQTATLASISESTSRDAPVARIEIAQLRAPAGASAQAIAVDVPMVADRGTAQLRIQLHGSDLNVTVRASDPALAAVLTADVAGLTQRLEGAGYQVENVRGTAASISLRASEPSSGSQSDASSSSGEQAQSSFEGGGPDGRSRHRSFGNQTVHDQWAELVFGKRN
jgi:hypothetical protein